MKKALFVCAFAGVALYACKKENKTITVNETIHDTINQVIPLNGNVDAETLTAGISVVYGTKVDATLPAPSTATGAPVLDTMYLRRYQTSAGGFLILQPQALDGHISGYYVQIVGSKSHFKVTYPVLPPPRKAAGSSHRQVSGNALASIVLNMPADITGDTFYVKYAAYDDNNLVSAAVTATVIVMPQGDAAFNSAFSGTWTYARYKEYGPDNYNQDWAVDTFYTDNTTYYECNDNKLTEVSTVTDRELVQRAYSYSWTFTFGKNTYKEVQQYATATLDTENSTCDKVVYAYSDRGEDTYNGYISYDAFTHRLTLISDQSESSISPSYETYNVVEITDHKLVLAYIDRLGEKDNQYRYLYEFYK